MLEAGQPYKKYADTSSPVRECQINLALQKVGVSTEKVNSLLSALETRLAAVTQPMVEEKCAPPQPRAVLVPMADQLTSVAESLQYSASRIDSLLNRLEL
jgi:hypothetical protein